MPSLRILIAIISWAPSTDDNSSQVSHPCPRRIYRSPLFHPVFQQVSSQLQLEQQGHWKLRTAQWSKWASLHPELSRQLHIHNHGNDSLPGESTTSRRAFEIELRSCIVEWQDWNITNLKPFNTCFTVPEVRAWLFPQAHSMTWEKVLQRWGYW